MKNKILSLLKTKFVGVSEQVLGRIADKGAKTATTDEEAKTYADGVTFTQVMESYADSRVTDAINTYKANHPEGGNGTQQQQQQNGTQGGEDAPAWAKSLIDANKALTDRLNKMEGQQVTASRQKQLDAVIGKLPDAIKAAYTRTSFDGLSDDEFNTTLADITKEVEGISTQVRQRGVQFGSPFQGNGGGGNQLTKEQTEAITHRSGGVKTEGQPF